MANPTGSGHMLIEHDKTEAQEAGAFNRIHTDNIPCVLCGTAKSNPTDSVRSVDSDDLPQVADVKGNLHAVRSRSTNILTEEPAEDPSPLMDEPPVPFLDVADADETSR